MADFAHSASERQKPLKPILIRLEHLLKQGVNEGGLYTIVISWNVYRLAPYCLDSRANLLASAAKNDRDV